MNYLFEALKVDLRVEGIQSVYIRISMVIQEIKRNIYINKQEILIFGVNCMWAKVIFRISLWNHSFNET